MRSISLKTNKLILTLVLAISTFIGINYVNAKQYEVEMDGTKYETYAESLSKLKIGENKITFLTDVTDDTYYGYWSGRDVTIDLNGHDFTTGGFYINGAKLKITGEGTITIVNNWAGFALVGSTEETNDYTVLTVDKDVTLKLPYATSTREGNMIVHTNDKYNDTYGVVVNFDGKMDSNKGDKLVGFYVSGNYKSTTDVYNIGKNAVIKAYSGIYAAGDATWNIAGNFDCGEFAVEIRAGALNVTGGVMSAYEIPTNVLPNGNGSTTLGAAIAVAQHTTKLPITINISGGEFKAFTSFNETNPQNNSESDLEKISINITGGKFTNIKNDEFTPKNSVYSDSKEKYIIGGEYEIEPASKYIADGYIVIKIDDLYKVVKDEADYKKVDEAVLKASNIEKDNYTKESVNILEEAISAVKRNLKYSDQSKVDAMEAAINDAINKLVPVGKESIEETTVVNKDVNLVQAGAVLSDEIVEVILDSVNEELEEKIEAAKESGIDVTTKVISNVIDEKTSNEEVKKDIIRINDSLTNGMKVESYLDLSLVVMAEDTILGNITETKKPLTFQVVIPMDLVKKNREFNIIRAHDGIVDIIKDTKLDGNILTFTTDKFSTYALAYLDNVVEENPATGNKIIPHFIGLGVTLLSLVFIYRKRSILY